MVANARHVGIAQSFTVALGVSGQASQRGPKALRQAQCIQRRETMQARHAPIAIKEGVDGYGSKTVARRHL